MPRIIAQLTGIILALRDFSLFNMTRLSSNKRSYRSNNQDLLFTVVNENSI